MYKKHSLIHGQSGRGLYYFGEGKMGGGLTVFGGMRTRGFSGRSGGCPMPMMVIEKMPEGSGIRPIGSGNGSGIIPFGGKRAPKPVKGFQLERMAKKFRGGNFNNDPRSPTELNKSQLNQLKELPKKSPVPIFDRHSLNLLSNVIQSKQIVEGSKQGGGMRMYK